MLEFKPTYKHDCDRCRFLGMYETFDLYYCECGPGPTVIARKSATPSDYISGVALARAVSLPKSPPGNEEQRDSLQHDGLPIGLRALRVAYLIAREMGLVDARTD